MLFAGPGRLGRIATWFVEWVVPPYRGRRYIVHGCRRGYISSKAQIHHSAISFGAHIFIDDRALIFQAEEGGPVQLGDWVAIHRDVIIQTGAGGSVTLGPEVRLNQRCILSAFKANINIGKGTGIGHQTVFFTYHRGLAPGQPIRKQPLESSGDIIIEEEAWVGANCTILDGVRIGKGAVVGAGSVVTKNIPDGAIAVGNPARVIKMRGETK
jgi:acetyltransferase-like isoleucine patch superfamily enzyme